jgi:hypothetical protein
MTTSASMVTSNQTRLLNRLARLSQLDLFRRRDGGTEREIVQLKEKLSRVWPEIYGPNYERVP